MIMKRKPKIQALVVPSSRGEYYIIQVQHKFLFFTWWETIKKGDNGIWNYGDARFTKEQVDELFAKWDEYWERGGKFETYKTQ